MMPPTALYALSLTVLLLPAGNIKKYPVRTEKQQKISTSVSITLQQKSVSGTDENYLDKRENFTPSSKTLEFKPDSVIEETPELESWMI